MRASRPTTPLMACLVAIALAALAPSHQSRASSPSATTSPATAPPAAAAKKPVRISRWEQLRKSITVPDADYAGIETCALSKCHGDTVQTWTHLAHSRYLLTAKDWPEELRSCEGCHGPASSHLDDQSHASIAKLGAHPEYVAALCARCHHEALEPTHFAAGVHLREGISCGTCHDVHRDHQSPALLRGPEARSIWQVDRAAPRKKRTAPVSSPAATADATAPESDLAPAPTPRQAPPVADRRNQSPTDVVGETPGTPRASQPAAGTPPARLDRGATDAFAGTRIATADGRVNSLCLSCHNRQTGEFRQNSHHPVYEGRMTCISCHDPHGDRESQRTTRTAEERCVPCHMEKRGPFVFAHDMTATGEGCMTCHSPHGSPNTKLVKLNGRGLCLQCHSDIAVDPPHQLRAGSCWRSGCHSQIHGSQTDPTFLHGDELAASGQPSGAVALQASPALMSAHVATESMPSWASPDGSGSQPLGAAPALMSAHAPTGFGPAPASSDAADKLIMLAASLSDAAASDGSAAATPPAAAGEKPSPQDSGTAGAAVAKGKPALPFTILAVGSYQNLGIKGNRTKYYQYNVKPSGWFFNTLRVGLAGDPIYGYGNLDWMGLDQDGQRIALNWDSPTSTGTQKQLRYRYDRTAFFAEPSVNPRIPSDRLDQDALLRIIPARRHLEVEAVANHQRVIEPGITRLGTAGAPGRISYSTDSFGPVLRVPVGAGRLRLEYNSQRFREDTGFQPGARGDLWRAAYDGDVGSRLSWFGTLSDVSISQNGLRSRSINQQARFGLTAVAGRRLSGSLQLSTERIKRPNTVNAYVKNNNSAVASIRYRPVSRVTVEGSYERQDMRRVNNLQNFLATPRWDGGWVSVRVVPNDRMTIYARRRTRRLHNDPAAAILDLTSTLPLLYDKDDTTDGYLTLALPRNALLYASALESKRFNRARQVGFDLNTQSVGTTVPLGRTFSINFDWNRQNWSGRGAVLIADPLNLNFGRPLLSNGSFWNLGAVYLLDRDTATINLYRSTSRGGESETGKGIALSYEHPLVRALISRLEFGWDDYRDQRLAGLDYSDAFFRIDLARRF